MPRKPQDVTDAELAVLEHLWETGGTSVRRLAESLYGSSTASDLATIQKLLERLEAKNCVVRDRNQWPHRFEACIERSDLIERRLQDTADELCGGSLSPLLTHLVKSEKLGQKEREQLRQLLNDLSKETRRGQKRS
ncbi:MAG: BlaI/MecI/CopY family transcriptional regulator [Pirellulales bacterium]|nr:BlaI/MecI/CopY family transcriptional regulator [Pirellulales bacterium]